MWIVENPELSAVGCVSRTRPDGSRDELQVEGHGFVVLTQEELNTWRLSPGFVALERAGRIVVYETDKMPAVRPVIPEGKKPAMQYDHDVARQIAFSDDQATQLARINLFKETEPDTGRDWQARAGAMEMNYLKNRHLPLLVAAEWYLTEYVEKRTADQNKRLRDIKEQIKKIRVLT